jgi:dipeptidase E
MKLYLSSFRFGNHPEELVKLADKNKKAAVIMNAQDYRDKEGRSRSKQNQIQQLSELGFEAKELDLRDYFGKQDKLRDYLSEIGLVWISGGNAFILQRAFEQSGFKKLIKDLVEKNKIVYAGYSAAVCVIVPTLHGAEMVDDPNIVPEGYEKEFSWNGLGLIKYNVAVHYRSDHPESENIEKEIAYYQKNKISYKILRDGEVIIISDGQERLFK